LGIQFKNNDFPFLINNEFILEAGSSSSIENDKNLSQLDDKEALQTVNTRVKQFTVSVDNIFKEMFLDNLTKYANSIGFENTVDLLIPVLSTIVTKIQHNFFIKFFSYQSFSQMTQFQ
jgi:hypothetical protein